MGQISRSCTYIFYLPLGVEIELFSLYKQRFPRYGPFFKISLFGHDTWTLAKVPAVAHTPLTTLESQISLRFALRVAISKILAFFFLFFPWPQC